MNDPNVAIDLNYNDQDKYCFDVSLETNTRTQELNNVDISVSFDSLLNKRLLIGTHFNLNNAFNEEQHQSYDLAAEYKYSDNLLFGVCANNNLNNFIFGLMHNRNNKTTLFGKVFAGKNDDDQDDRPLIDYSLGLQYELNEESNLNFIVNKNNTLNVRFSTGNGSNLNGFIAANLNLNDAQKRARMQYGIFIE